jgi:hypothetical protein
MDSQLTGIHRKLILALEGVVGRLLEALRPFSSECPAETGFPNEIKIARSSAKNDW